jgi:hypothetical protein
LDLHVASELPAESALSLKVLGGDCQEMEEFGQSGDAEGQSKLEENVAQVHASHGDDGHSGVVGKTEGRDTFPTPARLPEKNQPGIFEKIEASGVTRRNADGSSRLKENLRKLGEEFRYNPVVVGKTEGREFMPTSAHSTESVSGNLNVGKSDS